MAQKNNYNQRTDQFMKSILFTAILGLTALSVSAADPAERVKAAAKRLADQDSYSWTSTVKNEAATGAGGGGQFRMGPTEGKTLKSGLTQITQKFGEDRTVVSFVLKDKFAVQTQDGWRSSADLAANAAGGGGGGQGRGGFMGRGLANMKRPAEEAEALAGWTKELQRIEAGVLGGDLTTEGVKQMMLRGRRPAAGGQAPEPTEAKGSVKFWVKGGQLAKYEYHIQGKVTFNDREMEINRTTTVELKDIGSTQVTVPDEVKKMIE
jgi:hypothetical protein